MNIIDTTITLAAAIAVIGSIWGMLKVYLKPIEIDLSHIDSDIKELKDNVKESNARTDARTDRSDARTDRLYQMFVDPLKERKS